MNPLRLVAPPRCYFRPHLEILEPRNLLSFLPAVNYPTGLAPNVVMTADFNGDGNLDFALNDTRNSDIGVYLGNGDGSFQAAQTYATGLTPWSIAVGEFDGDSIPDLVTTNLDANTVSVFLGNGDGTFKAKLDFATAARPQDVKVADLNGDGKADLVVSALATSGNSKISVLLGNGDGTFQAHVDTPVASYPGFMTFTSVNGVPTLVVPTYSVTSGVSLFLSNGDGTFQSPTVLNAGIDPTWADTGDFNNDGIPDLAVSNYTTPGTVQVLLGNPDGTFQPAVPYTVGNVAESVAVGDFNGDGNLDLAVANDETGVTVLLGNGDGTFGSRSDYATGQIPAAAVGDFNGDGFPDLVVANYGSNTVSVLLNAADWSTPLVSAPSRGRSDLPTADVAAGASANPGQARAESRPLQIPAGENHVLTIGTGGISLSQGRLAAHREIAGVRGTLVPAEDELGLSTEEAL